jgi:hypothetical protein
MCWGELESAEFVRLANELLAPVNALRVRYAVDSRQETREFILASLSHVRAQGYLPTSDEADALLDEIARKLDPKPKVTVLEI